MRCRFTTFLRSSYGSAIAWLGLISWRRARSDDERALRELSLSIEAREPDHNWIRTDIRLDSLRNTTAFEYLADRMLEGR